MNTEVSQLKEDAFVFECEGEELVAIINNGNDKTGVLVVVGGPQYRVGSHRQFTLLARKLAGNDVPVMRFDYRGMGDSTGKLRDFEDVSHDITEAINQFYGRQPDLEKIVLWGLCDAASAALFYAHQDERIAGLVLLNPWVRTQESLNETHIKNYYSRRIMDINFWKTFFKGKLKFSSIRAFSRDLLFWLWNKIKKAFSSRHGGDGQDQSLPGKMLSGLKNFKGKILLVISEQDLTADEFLRVSDNPEWQNEFERCQVKKVFIEDANHTFSTQAWRNQVEQATLDWVKQL